MAPAGKKATPITTIASVFDSVKSFFIKGEKGAVLRSIRGRSITAQK